MRPGFLLLRESYNFYSRPCGRGDATTGVETLVFCSLFLLTPLREGRRQALAKRRHPPGFLLTPLREGRPAHGLTLDAPSPDFYSRPCGRGDSNFPQVRHEVLRQIAER